MAQWMTTVTDEQKQWLRETAEEAGINGSYVIQELLSRIMAEGAKEFKASLVDARVRIQLAELAEKKAEIAEQEKELRLKLSSKKPALV